MDLRKVQDFSKNILKDDTTGHDWQHALRVEKNALKISPEYLKAEDLSILRASAWLHDTIDEKIAPNKRAHIQDIEQLLIDSQASTQQIEEILYIIQNLSFSKNIDQKQELSFLGEIVQDADRLDALGAIGIARAFYYGGSQQHALYDETEPRKAEEITSANYREQNSVVNHFYEKLLRLKETMNTQKGFEEALLRTKIMENYLENLFEEIHSI